MVTTTQFATPATPPQWHAVMQQHITHELTVDSAYQAHTQKVLVQSIRYDGRMSAFVDGEWLPDLSMCLFFGSRSVACQTCRPTAVPVHTHRFVIVETYSATDALRFKQGECQCGEIATFSVPVP